jgi:hypothetical protein
MLTVDKCIVTLYNKKAWFRKKGGFICEKNISTEQAETPKNAWLQSSHGNCWWSTRTRTPQIEGPRRTNSLIKKLNNILKYQDYSIKIMITSFSSSHFI